MASVLRPVETSDGDDNEKLVERWIEPDPYHRGDADARVVGSGVAVWALVKYYLDVYERDIERVAADFGVPLEAVRAAISYYERHKQAIDARITLNVA